MIMIEAEWPEVSSRAPAPDGSSPVVIFVYVEDVDQVVERAVARGAKVLSPAANQFWGDRTAWVMDPAGHVSDDRHARGGYDGGSKARALVVQSTK